MKRLLASAALALAPLCSTAAAQTAAPVETPAAKAERLKWFADAKLGIFIHWGIYAVNGTTESWSFFNGETTHDEYMAQRKGFTAAHYDPQAWADLIRRSGARYAVMTTRHHDGMALWNTKQGLNVVKDTPAHRDLIAPFVNALRKDNLKVGLYYSLPDWSYPDYDIFTRKEKRYDIAKDPARWQRYRDYFQNQIRDIGNRFNPDLYWFDGDWDHSAQEWQADKVRQIVLGHNPKAIINSRLAGYGDYATPEQGLPVHRPAAPVWELCLTSNMSWGYRPSDNDYKTPGEVIKTLIDTVAMGGNLLLDIGPREDGSIDPRQVNILEQLGRWTHRNAEAIYGSRAGISLDYVHAPTSLSADGKTLYIFLEGRPNEDVIVKGLENNVVRARVLGSSAEVGHHVTGKLSWNAVPGLLHLTVPDSALDPVATVIALDLDKPIQLFDAEVKPIESN